MRRIVLTVLTALCLLPCSFVFAQDYDNTPVAISKEKVRMGGQVYYSHLVLERQTLFSISKAYGVSLEEIYNANPTLELKSEGLKVQQIILIPVKGDSKLETVAVPADTKAEDDEDYIEHIAKWYETLGTISFKYDISVDILMKYNNLSSQNLSTRQVVKIPQGKTLEKLIAESQSSQKEHAQETVQKMEPEQEMEPGVIPEAKLEAEAEQQQSFENYSDRVDTLGISSTDRINVSIILPLGANGNVNNSNFDFYCGALLAIKDLESEEIHTELKVFDLSSAMPLGEDLEGSNLILGPVSPQDIESIRSIAPSKAAVISPLDPKGITAAKSAPGIIQAPSSTDNQNEDLVKWIGEDMQAGDKIILVTEKNAVNTSAADYLAQSGLEYDVLSYGILEGRDITGTLTSLMTDSGTNRVLIASDKEAFANDVIRNINLMIFKKYNTVLYAPSRMRNFETIEVENFHTSGMHLSNSYFVDYGSAKVQSFLYAYRALCGTEPTPFAYQGYDTAYYFIKQYAQSGPAWVYFMEPAKGLQSNFNFIHEEGAGYYNVGVRRVIYGPEYSTEIVN